MSLLLAGLDVGTTTTSLMLAKGSLVRNCVTGRNELGNVVPVYRSEPVFTRYRDGQLDIEAVESHFDRWFAEAGLEFTAITGGGALITGLAAQSPNAPELARLIKGRFQNAVVARADDPCLESWLAFMGNSLELSRASPLRPVVNLDIGGGTTNIAWGLAGEVLRCGCYFVGARHIQVDPGTYLLKSLSTYGEALLSELGIAGQPGFELVPHAIERVLDFYVGLLEAVVTGRSIDSTNKIARLHCQAEFVPPETRATAAGDSETIITLSGGVGELAYRHARGEPFPGTTAFGDLGIDLATRICQSAILGKDLQTHVPVGLGRATVQGLTIHSTEISGSTLFLPHPEILPLTDLPILGALSPVTQDDDLSALFDLAGRAGRGACLRVHLETPDAVSVKALGRRLAQFLERRTIPESKPLVLLTSGNIGKTLGQYATRWGQLDSSLVVIDEVPDRPAHFATIGVPQNGLIPVAFHGLEARLD